MRIKKQHLKPEATELHFRIVPSELNQSQNEREDKRTIEQTRERHYLNREIDILGEI